MPNCSFSRDDNRIAPITHANGPSSLIIARSREPRCVANQNVRVLLAFTKTCCGRPNFVLSPACINAGAIARIMWDLM